MARYKIKSATSERTYEAHDAHTLDMIRTPQGLHVLHTDHGYLVTDPIIDLEHKKIQFVLDGRTYHFTIEDDLDLLIQELGMDRDPLASQDTLTAPMPGLILSVEAATGQQVSAGQPLMILQAMKMENVLSISSPQSIAHVHVQPGDKVQKGDILITFDKNP